MTGSDKVKYQIHDQIVANLPKCRTYEELEKWLQQASITIRYKYRSGAEELPENIQGVLFEKNDIAFKGSEIDRKFSHANLKKELGKNMSELLKAAMGWDDSPSRTQTPVLPKPEPSAPTIILPKKNNGPKR